MVNPAVAQRLQLLGLCVLGLLLAVLLGSEIGNNNYAPLALGGLIAVVTAFTLLSGRFFWVVTIASSFLQGTFPILRGQFTPFQLLMAIGVTKFLIEDVVLRHSRIKGPPRLDLLLIAGFMAIITIHGVHDRFGMKFLGSSIWGGRNYVNVYVGLAAFFVAQSIPMNHKHWSKLPYVILAVALFDLAIAIITTVFPGSIYEIYPFYSAVSRAGVEEILTGTSSDTSRIVAFGTFGVVLITLIFAFTSLREILHPSNLSRLILLGVGFLSVLYSSFRSSVVDALAVTLIAGVRDLKGKVVILLFLMALFFFGLSFVNSEIVRLPKEVQRSLVFLPGHWDIDVSQDAVGSNNFRREVWNLWEREFFPLHPWLGRGFGFRSGWDQPSVYQYDPEANRRSVEIGHIHNGFFAALDSLGVIGTIFFVIWNLRLLIQTLRVPFKRRDSGSAALRFVALYLATSILTYWYAAADVGAFLPQEFALAGVFFLLNRKPETETEPVPAVQRQTVRRMVAT